MPVYPAGTPVKQQVLNQLRDNLGAITTVGGGYKHIVRRSEVFGGQEIQLGRSLPAVVVVPDKDTVSQYLSCQRIESVMEVTVYAAVRVTPGSAAWRSSVEFLLADIRKAVNADMQLGGKATYIDLVGEDLPELVDNNIAVGQVHLRVAYRHDFDNPNQ